MRDLPPAWQLWLVLIGAVAIQLSPVIIVGFIAGWLSA